MMAIIFWNLDVNFLNLDSATEEERNVLNKLIQSTHVDLPWINSSLNETNISNNCDNASSILASAVSVENDISCLDSVPAKTTTELNFQSLSSPFTTLITTPNCCNIRQVDDESTKSFKCNKYVFENRKSEEFGSDLIHGAEINCTAIAHPPTLFIPYMPVTHFHSHATDYLTQAATGTPIYMINGSLPASIPIVSHALYPGSIFQAPIKLTPASTLACYPNHLIPADSHAQNHSIIESEASLVTTDVRIVSSQEENNNMTPISEDVNDSQDGLIIWNSVEYPMSELSAKMNECLETKPKSWASLFHDNQCNRPIALVSPVTAVDTPISEFEEPGSAIDKQQILLKELLKDIKLDHKLVSYVPRGLYNRANWCYINSVLQALLACPPFHNLLRAIGSILNTPSKKAVSSIPLLDSIAQFVGDFYPMMPLSKEKRKDKLKFGEVVHGSSFEPIYIYNILSHIQCDAFKVEGRQEDAEEFLSGLLNGLHEEVLHILKEVSSPVSNHLEYADDDDEDWMQVQGHKKKGCVTRTTKVLKSPISAIFRGQTRSIVQPNEGPSRHVLQPFFTIQLDIQNEHITNIQHALEHLMSRELLHGVIDSQTKQEVRVVRQLQFEELPPVLILHVKRFLYEKSDGCQKVTKIIRFDVDLEINKGCYFLKNFENNFFLDLLSVNSRSRYAQRQYRLYKLFAVISHEGKETYKGHYVTDVYHAGYSTWMHFDDSTMHLVSESHVLQHDVNSSPYLLFYRRGDTLSFQK